MESVRSTHANTSSKSSCWVRVKGRASSITGRLGANYLVMRPMPWTECLLLPPRVLRFRVDKDGVVDVRQSVGRLTV